MTVLSAGLTRYGSMILLLLAAVILTPLYWTALQTPATGIYHDDSLYLVTARTLAEGRGYWIESIPTPIAQTKYPVLFPALLALVWKLAPAFPGNVFYFKLVPFLAALVWLCLSYVLVRRESGSPLFAATAVALVASSPQVIFLSTTVLSETLFAALATGALLLWAQQSRTQSWAALAGSAVLAAAAYHTRTIGFCLILAGILALLWQRKWRESLVFAAIAGGLALPWIVWQAMHRSAPDPYLSQENYYSAYNIIFSFTWDEKIRIALTNLVYLPFSVQALFDLSWGGIIGLICVPFIVRALFRHELPLGVRGFLLLSFGVILLWVWPPLRFIVPLLPLLLWAVWSGMPMVGRKVLMISCWLLFAQGAWASYGFSVKAKESGFWCPVVTGKEEWREFRKQLDWLATNTASDAIIQSNVDPTIYLFTQRRAIRGSHQNASLSWYLDRKEALGTAAEFEATLRGNRVGYVVETPWSWFLESRFMADLIAKSMVRQPERFRVVQQSEVKGFRILELQPAQEQDK
jgi:hypothetical protein